MLKLVDTSIELLRSKHKNGETFYWVLYYTYLSPQEVGSVLDIIEAIRPHVKYISYRTYYRVSPRGDRSPQQRPVGVYV